jgi:hypothetical protein
MSPTTTKAFLKTSWRERRRSWRERRGGKGGRGEGEGKNWNVEIYQGDARAVAGPLPLRCAASKLSSWMTD